MYSIPPNEKLIETKTCRHCSASFPITDKDLDFYDKVSPIFDNKKYSIPTPTLCPDCRQQRRLAWRNRRKIYKRKCDATRKDIISMFSPDKPYKVYHTQEWESDRWDPKSYGRAYDFNRPFFEQFDELLRIVPLPHLAIIHSSLENAEYVNGANRVKNAYLSNSISHVEDVYYSEAIYDSTSIVDCLNVKHSEQCYECVNSIGITNGKYLNECQSCNHCTFCFFCIGCDNCIGCINLRNKQYCIFNIQYSPEEYEKKKQLIGTNEIQKQLDKVSKTYPHRSTKIINSHNVTGDDFVNSSDCFNSFDIIDCKNIKNSIFITGNSSDCQDISFWGDEISLCYEGTAIGLNSSKILFSAETYAYVSNSSYCFFCYPNCDFLFGCIGIRGAKYCILNKQYTREEYNTLVPQIIEHMISTGEWGEFFPSSMSPFGYNETIAQEYFPLTREEILVPSLRGTKQSSVSVVSGAPGSPRSARDDENTETFLHGTIFNWSDYEAPFSKVEKIIPASKLPEDITKIPDDILNWAIECEVTKRPYRIIRQELEFYRKHHLPIPRRHPDQRHLDRMAQRNPRKLFERKCDKCSKDMSTTYSPERKETVYCEECYGKEVIG